ncbi:MAG: hypothetical protein LLG01_13425 [Planctomycetaceae bacterium]|nr:hypothetical protein [Planctomycetaceae bacterium]
MKDNITDMKAAKKICLDLQKYPTVPHQPAKNKFISQLHDLASACQEVQETDVASYMRENALPELLRIFDGHCGHPDANKSDLLFMLKIFAMYGYIEGVKRIVAASRSEDYAGEYLWSIIFSIVSEDAAASNLVLDGLRDPLPSGFAGIAFLDMCNTLARGRGLAEHPFDSQQGRTKLESWLSSNKEDDVSNAISATAALPFLQSPGRDALFSLAMDHLSPAVQLEGAWACAHTGNQRGLNVLQEKCLDVTLSTRAQKYLQELGREDMIPESIEPDFMARAEMSAWLEYPTEFGRPPTSIEVYDTRELYWPPTDDLRQVWLLKYLYDYDNLKDAGLGMVGSTTFALFSETTSTMSPEDAYGLHCAWELMNKQDSRAPKERSAAAGRKILSLYNDGF